MQAPDPVAVDGTHHLTLRRRPLPRRRNALLFRIAFGRTRPFCYGCICLTADERRYERRVFALARAWAQMLAGERQRQQTRQP